MTVKERIFMLLGYRMKKRSMPAYDRVIVPAIKGYDRISEEQTPPVSAAKRRLRGALRAAACIVLAFTLIGVIASRNAQGPGAANSFTLVAYAASSSADSVNENGYTLALKSFDSSSGVPMQKNSTITLPVIKIYLAKDADGNNYGSNMNDFSIFEGANIVESSKRVEYSSGFQFSGSNIDRITMTSQKGKFIAYDFSVVNPIHQKYAKMVDKGNGVTVGVIDDKLFSDSDRAFLDSHFVTGQTIFVPSTGYTVNWYCAINNNEETVDTITITIKYTDGSSQDSVVSISESENGVITAELQ